ncbi:SPla/RYanodine receptor SPRY [Penicillium alfredii]|uniref:Protein FYV10 n=1 Tax=Penicillium alfredii TaxID=1506179 RepID=A0A9W9F9X3_9EURO|nr:SPla/RYanodine receptor SPRY [Penicillium alfredii]KAJ5096306.1 SPla/RYanodine receptor SPRY [Penicillium alfredii]
MADVPFPPSGGARGAPTSSYPGPSISSAPRRSSYASVVSGNAFSPPTAGSFAHLLNDTNPVSSYPPPSQPDSRLHRALSGVDAADMHLNSAWRSPASPDSVPSYSRKFASYLRPAEFPHGPGLADGPSFFTPSYLRNSRYVSRLDDAHRAKLAAQHRDASSSTSTSNPPLSASSSHVHLPRMAPSHRGMTYEIIEKEPPTPADQLMPLPIQWSTSDKYAGLELSNDGLDVRYTGPVHKHDHEAAALRADHPMPPQCGIYYFEIKIESKPKEGMIGIGFSSPKASVERLPGWEQESWAYHGDDGKSFFGESQGQGRPYGPTFGVGDTVGCGVNFSTGSAFFTKNGVFLGNAFHELRNVKLYPSVGMKKQPPVHLKANFGQEPFVFDIDGMVRHERASVHSEINATSTDSLHPPLDEPALLQELVAQFLAHDGYVETARAFAEEVATETTALQNGRDEPLKKYEVEEDREAINRNKIRAAILDGDIDKALKHTKAYYTNVLEDYPHIHFKLRCRKFLEMMRRSNELFAATAAATSKRRQDTSSGISDEHAVFDQEMELDDGEGWEADGMDTEEPETAAQFSELLTEAVQYGQQLRMDYPSDENGGDKKMLEDIFSLVAYPDPKRSVHGHYLDPAGRVAVAEELNSAILVSLGKSSAAALERLYQQTEVLVNEISEDGGAGAFINVRNDILL